MYNMQNDIPSENTLKHLSSHAGFTKCHKTSVPVHSEQGEYFDHVNYVSKHTHLSFKYFMYVTYPSNECFRSQKMKIVVHHCSSDLELNT